MKIAALNESQSDRRAALSPGAVKTLTKMGLTVLCEQELGACAGFSDALYEEAGASVLKQRKKVLEQADVLVAIAPPDPTHYDGLKSGALLIAPIDQDPQSALIAWAKTHHISLFSMNLIPRLSRAQSMDSLSSQANLAGYRAVIEAVSHYHRAVPMMMTAAGMIHPAKVLILGAGVAGLQAIATAKRLGAVVKAFDVRQAAKEQVESLGATFIEVKSQEESETSGGYAKEMSEAYQQQQAELIDQHAQEADIIITTALIPGRQAPLLLRADTVKKMKPSAVIVDLATSRGGNCELSEKDKTVTRHGVTLIGESNLAGLVPATASELYANNLVHLLKLLIDEKQTLHLHAEDEIIQQALLLHQGEVLPYLTPTHEEKAHA